MCSRPLYHATPFHWTSLLPSISTVDFKSTTDSAFTWTLAASATPPSKEESWVSLSFRRSRSFGPTCNIAVFLASKKKLCSSADDSTRVAMCLCLCVCVCGDSPFSPSSHPNSLSCLKTVYNYTEMHSSGRTM